MSVDDNSIVKLNKAKTSSTEFSLIETKQTISDEKQGLNKIKKVTFNGVEIIDVESYKRYNQDGILFLESLEKNCMDECKCNLF